MLLYWVVNGFYFNLPPSLSTDFVDKYRIGTTVGCDSLARFYKPLSTVWLYFLELINVGVEIPLPDRLVRSKLAIPSSDIAIHWREDGCHNQQFKRHS